MKRIAQHVLPVFGAVAAIGLVGCGTLPAPVASTPTEAGIVTSQVDNRKMQLIDREARKRGVQVVWINPPRRNPAGG